MPHESDGRLRHALRFAARTTARAFLKSRVLDERIAAVVTDILSDKGARMSAFGDQNALELDFDVAAITGTSKGFRDNVAVGYTRDVTVAVWVGNFDGSPMADVSGITGAGPIFHTVIEAAARGRERNAVGSLSLREDASRLGLARTPICALSGDVASKDCPHRVHEWLPEGSAGHAPVCATHERVRVDVRNGLRAGPACSRDVTEERVLERWSPVYEPWAKRTGRAISNDESSPNCPGAESVDSSISIAEAQVTYPFEGARFVVDPERPAELQLLEIRVARDTPSLDLRVDGTSLGRSRSWPLRPGDHVLSLGPSGSSPVRITVH